MALKIITISFYILFFFTPLFWSPNSFELFEYNKMMLVYGLTIIITATWLLKMIGDKKFLIKRTPLDIPLLLFLAANVFSTIFSIDPHTSIWGYYSRSNGGLLSTFSYIFLYYALVSNFEKEQVLKFLKAALFGGLAVALWAIPEHFGVSPSCIILTGEFNASCWVQDVQARVFATLGQPNWLAAYLAMLIFPALYFLLTSTKKSLLILYSSCLILFYLAFTFTYSRGATLGLIAGVLFFTIIQLSFLWRSVIIFILNLFDGLSHQSLPQIPFSVPKQLVLPHHWRIQLLILIIFIFINITFGSALTDLKLISKFSPPARPSLTQAASSTQMESGGTESGKIRLIVWRGAVNIFKHYPVFGSGVETFAYAYYSFRPAEHNLVSEWDFLYNKAHNEFLNYLATTGLLGFASYLAIILTFIAWSIKQVLESSRKSLESSKNLLDSQLLTLVILSAYITYLIQNIFGFSVVMIALFFYLFPAIAFIVTDSTKFLIIRIRFLSLIYRRPFYTKLTKIIVIILFGTLGFKFINFYMADGFFAKGIRFNEAGNPGKAYNNLTTAVNLNPKEPFYRSEIGYAAAGSAVALSEEDATLSSKLKIQADQETEKAIKISPKNISYLRTAVRTYFLLASIDKNYTDKTLQSIDKAIQLAPTDPKLIYNKALILGQEGKNTEAVEWVKKAIEIKSNYREAYITLGELYFAQGEKSKAIEQANIVLKMIPGDSDALKRLAEWQKP